MIETITLENFKGFKKLEELKIKPITILCGTNSCGKSSILQSVLLLKQTVESKNSNQKLLLNGRFVHLGTFDNIIFKKKLQNKVVFDFCFKIKKDNLFSRKNHPVPFRFFFRELISENGLNLKQAEYLIYYKISLKALEKKKNKKSLTSIVVDSLSFKIETKAPGNVVTPEASIEINLGENDLYLIRWENILSRYKDDYPNMKTGEVTAKMNFANLIPISIDLHSESVDNKRPSEVDFVFIRLNDILQTIFSSYTYIGPLREEPSRRYIYEDEIIEIGIKGENAAYIYLAEKDKQVKNHYFYDVINDSFSEEKAFLTLNDALRNWFNLMNIKDLKPEPNNEIIYLNLNSSSAEKTRVNIADVGFGVSQIFPIVLEGLRMPKGNTLLLEQPEIHLHPNLQMQMADYFISLALSNKNVIVETHSDHIINRLVRRIVEDEKFNLKELIGIYFIKPTDNGSVYEEVCIDDKRGIINWPIDFFDQTATEQEKILQAGLKKRKAEREKKERSLL